VRLLTQQSSPPPTAVVTPPAVVKPAQQPARASSRTRNVRQGEKVGLSVAEALRQLEQLEQETHAGQTVTVSLAWQIVEEGGKA
jgi:hypothetical protein